MLRSSQLGTSFLVSDNSAPAARRGTVTTVTDEGLLDHLTTDVLEEQQQFVKARSTSSPDKRHTAFVPRAIANGGEAETVLRTDHNGRVVEVRDAFRYVQASLCCVSLVSRKAQVFAWGRLAARALSVFRSVSVFVFVCVVFVCVRASVRDGLMQRASSAGPCSAGWAGAALLRGSAIGHLLRRRRVRAGSSKRLVLALAALEGGPAGPKEEGEPRSDGGGLSRRQLGFSRRVGRGGRPGRTGCRAPRISKLTREECRRMELV